MMKISILLSLVLAIFSSAQSVQRLKVTRTPDVMQTDPAGHLPYGGRYACAAVAVANSLVGLHQMGTLCLPLRGATVKQRVLSLAEKLSGPQWMRLAPSGIAPQRLSNEVERYLEQQGLSVTEKKIWDWNTYHCKTPPDPHGFYSGIHKENAVLWLLVGKYRASGDTLRCRALHWVTVVSYNKNSDESHALIVHCPSPRSGVAPVHELILIKPMKTEMLLIPQLPDTISSRGFMEIESGLRWIRPGERAVINGAVAMRLSQEAQGGS